VSPGSKNSPIGDIQNKIAYVMKVRNKMSVEKYVDVDRNLNLIIFSNML